MSKLIGVLGCGWLGLPLALELKKKGFTVRGTTSTAAKMNSLKAEGIEPYQIVLRSKGIEGPIEEFLHQMDILIINVPPGMRRRGGDSYIGKMERLFDKIKTSDLSKVIFVSSTSVYGDAKGEVDENTPVRPLTESARHLAAVEEKFMGDASLQTSVIRFGGLIGENRHPVKMLSGRRDLKNGNDAVNLIHRNDCIYMIMTIIKNEWWNEIFNGVYPDHPKKVDYYTAEAEKRGLQPPGYIDPAGEVEGKMIKSKNFLIKKESFFTSIHS